MDKIDVKESIELREKKVKAEKTLALLARQFCNDKLTENQLKKLNAGRNDELKTAMDILNLKTFSAGDFILTRSSRTIDEFDEDLLISKLKTLGIPKPLLRSIIRKKEYIDYNELEKALYADEIDGADLESCQTSREVVSLRVKKLKEE